LVEVADKVPRGECPHGRALAVLQTEVIEDPNDFRTRPLSSCRTQRRRHARPRHRSRCTARQPYRPQGLFAGGLPANRHADESPPSCVPVCRGNAEAQHRQALAGYWPQLSAKAGWFRLDEPPNFVFPASSMYVPSQTVNVPAGTAMVTIPANSFAPRREGWS